MEAIRAGGITGADPVIAVCMGRQLKLRRGKLLTLSVRDASIHAWAWKLRYIVFSYPDAADGLSLVCGFASDLSLPLLVPMIAWINRCVTRLLVIATHLSRTDSNPIDLYSWWQTFFCLDESDKPRVNILLSFFNTFWYVLFFCVVSCSRRALHALP